VVFQGGLLFPHLSVRDNVSFGLANGRRESGADKVAVDQWLDRLGLLFLADRKPRDLSGGEAQRVALARALATQPSCLILDEPMGALDVSARGLVRSMVADHLSTFEGPTLVITHDPAEAFLLADTIIVLEGGVVSQQGTASDLQMHPASSYVADVVGTNLVEGTARGGIVDVAGHQLVVADVDLSGSVLVSFHPRAVSLHTNRPVGSQRNAWATTVRQIDDLGHTCRIRTGDPLALIAEVTKSAVEGLALTVGSDIWVAIKATELAVAAIGDPA
jgi:molybdate transport system ATP-binding protein